MLFFKYQLKTNMIILKISFIYKIIIKSNVWESIIEARNILFATN